MPWLSDQDYKLIRESVPMLAVDCVLIHNNKVLLIKRATKPFEGFWALPGGHVRFGETVEQAVVRNFHNETNLEVGIDSIVGVYSAPNRDPWGHVITICYLVKWIGGELTTYSAESSKTKYVDIEEIPQIMAFDHRQLLIDGINLIQGTRNPSKSLPRDSFEKIKQPYLPNDLYDLIIKSVPVVAVDGVLFINEKVLLVRRNIEPAKGSWALPGGLVVFGETVEEAIKREFKEETGLDVKIINFVNIYSKPERNPVGHIISICFLLEKVGGEIVEASSEVSEIKFFKDLPSNMAFDHSKMIDDAGELIA